MKIVIPLSCKKMLKLYFLLWIMFCYVVLLTITQLSSFQDIILTHFNTMFSTDRRPTSSVM